MHILQAEEMRKGSPRLPKQDANFKLYYDETNNFRRLRLGEGGLNSPNNPFVLGGVALPAGQELKGWDELRKSLGIQPSAPEIKLKHVAKGAGDSDHYEFTLSQPRVSTLLQWLIDHEIMVHYSALDPLYFAILDIIESIQADDRFNINDIHAVLKSELHYAVLQDINNFLSLMRTYSYPDVPRSKVSQFLGDIALFVDSRLPVDRNPGTRWLRQTLKTATALPDMELIFLHDNQTGELIDGLGTWFMHSVFTFKNATHIFDEETEIQKYFETFEMRDGSRRLDYTFVKSEDEIGIQLSDVIAGIFGRHFRYLNAYSATNLIKRRDSFTTTQAENLCRLRTLVDRSDSFSGGLFFKLMPADSEMKNAAFLHGEVIPSFMWHL